ncbi:MAG: hypothetical protein WD049_01290 [Candidatus Paceibacterota bacterium]
MAILSLAIPVCVVAIFGTIGLVTLYEMLLGNPPTREGDQKKDAPNPHDDGCGDATCVKQETSAKQEMEAWLREVEAMERF